MGDVDTFQGRWVARIEYNGREVQCHESCDGWYVDRDNSQGHCRCHSTEFWMSPGGMVVCRLGGEDAS